MDVGTAESANSLDRTARKLTDDIQNMSNYRALYNEIQVRVRYSLLVVYIYILPGETMYSSSIFLQRLVASSAVDKDDFKNSLITALRDHGLETEIRNTVFHWARSRVLLNELHISRSNSL